MQLRSPNLNKLLVFLGALVIGALLIPAALWLGPLIISPARPVVWKWSDAKSSLDYSVRSHLSDYELKYGTHPIITPVSIQGFYEPISIWTRDHSRLVYHLEDGHKEIVFTRREDTLFVAEFHPICTGCSVVAIDLATGNRIWETQLQGIGPTEHSKYRNRVNIETDGERVIVYGNESHGKYVEHLDVASGKILLNRKFTD